MNRNPLNLCMSTKDRYISLVLLFVGILLYPLFTVYSGESSLTVEVIGYVLLGLGILYELYALYRNKEYAKLKWQAIRLGVMVGVLLLLVLIWGNK